MIKNVCSIEGCNDYDEEQGFCPTHPKATVESLVQSGWFAAIGTDGLREVVWGLGKTPEQAERDAREQAARSESNPEIVRTVAISAERAERIKAGDVSTQDL